MRDHFTLVIAPMRVGLGAVPVYDGAVNHDVTQSTRVIVGAALLAFGLVLVQLLFRSWGKENLVEGKDPALAQSLSPISRLRLSNRVGAIDHRLRRLRRVQRRPAQADGPVIEPIAAFFADESVWQAVGLITQRVLQGHESIPAFAEQIEEFADVFGFQIVSMEQQDLFRLIAEQNF
jgi:hypothetical protein